MANYTHIGNGEYIGLSTDTKPTTGIQLGYIARETDTGNRFVYDGTFWWLAGYPSPFSNRLVGSFPGGISGTAGDGLLGTLSQPTGVGSQTFTLTATNGRFFGCKTGAVSGNKGGLYINSAIFSRPANPRMRMVFQMTGAMTNLNTYFGFIGGTSVQPATADPYSAGIDAVTFGVNTGNASNFIVLHNDTTASASIVEDTGVPIDTTTIHTVNMVADNPNSRFAWNIDNGPYHFITTRIPSTINALAPYMTMETEDAVAKTFSLYNWIIQSDT